MTARFMTGYMDIALDDLPQVIENAKQALADVDFDTIVGTGFSGGVVIPALAMALGKDFVLIRKEDDDSHHGGGRLIGKLGQRWVFVDDFISSGATRRRVIDKVAAAAVLADHQTTHVGDYVYAERDDWAGRDGVYTPVALTYPGFAGEPGYAEEVAPEADPIDDSGDVVESFDLQSAPPDPGIREWVAGYDAQMSVFGAATAIPVARYNNLSRRFPIT